MDKCSETSPVHPEKTGLESEAPLISRKEKLSREIAQLVFYNPGPSTKDLLGFRPEYSNREKRNLNRLIKDNINDEKNPKKNGKSPLYDNIGVFLETGKDVCDCLIEECSGCHFPCPQCQSTKCGSVCRCSRKWAYDSVYFVTK
ncbi:ARL14 effector protein [Hydra vulgaris]|uniref:ARL14 effector protein n=1 Tax=Hydra vulgaris TaxID=6087 RepID=A0ABM4DDY5_HYDVU